MLALVSFDYKVSLYRILSMFHFWTICGVYSPEAGVTVFSYLFVAEWREQHICWICCFN